MMHTFLLPLLAVGFRLRTQHSVTTAEPVTVLTVDATVEYVDYVNLAKHEDLLELTRNSIRAFVMSVACNTSATVDSSFLQLGRGNDTNATDDKPGEPAAADGDACAAEPTVRFFGNPFHIHAEMASDPATATALKDAGFPKRLSDYLLTVPGVLLYASAPPICEGAEVTEKTVTSVIPGCEAHLPKLLNEMRHAYTNRMVPWALSAACGSFATTLSFANSGTPDAHDKAFCETASKHLMRTHYNETGFQHNEGIPEGKDYQDWCVEVCEYRHGPTAICSRGAASGNGTAAGNATNATAGNGTDGGNGTNASNATAFLHKLSDVGVKRRMRQMKRVLRHA